ncbi:immunity 52 family protein [Burkholderia pseudomallei]|nr:immunity 52 family protein [Burkholderia pseudomallei]MEB5486072.1 immunity 52 family protein [Burkholderia pseudomallei]MEB5492618.1 immunity 52 family protein [Burkholderia pseudomallei]MEB5499481.1 immunity 52 family protein [Burkholderia pseudomallei]MEB5504393.1 immunity 52 family protein [Burkholderia pseudomallei]MEB5512275.1 immunity 52 family protein [Burkholderia pseudomallei]
MTTNMQIVTLFRDAPDFAEPGNFEAHLVRLWSVIEALSDKDDRLGQWYLTGSTEEEALLYPAFEASGAPSTALLAVLKTKYQGKRNRAKVVGLWNGHNNPTDGATLKLSIDTGPLPSEVAIDPPKPRDAETGLAPLAAIQGIVSLLVATYTPAVVSVAPMDYFEKKVFDDKPGVGWMLYLPKVITQQQVPEARALISVPAKGKQTGTIIVSVTDAPFSVDNPEHVAIANRIEIRLVDQDLLPAYVDI